MTATLIIGYVASCLSVIAFLPQVVKAWRTGSTRDVSAGMFLLVILGAVLWMSYAYLRQDWPVFMTNAAILVLASITIGLKLRFR